MEKLETFAFEYKNPGRTETERAQYDHVFDLAKQCQLLDAHRYIRGVLPLRWRSTLLRALSAMKKNAFIYQAWKRDEKEIGAILNFRDPILDPERAGLPTLPIPSLDALAKVETGRQLTADLEALMAEVGESDASMVKDKGGRKRCTGQ